ncbi:unnamed protein product [Cylicostephanus goldi]|uniref:Uncharacterized protein n=1 Tax=Cylicostephanus goldi TaxID=71465 RepID=A0A3P6S2D6_CYLGO|nr:unnamed protein product [Cylicostephanus goldi]
MLGARPGIWMTINLTEGMWQAANLPVSLIRLLAYRLIRCMYRKRRTLQGPAANFHNSVAVRGKCSTYE